MTQHLRASYLESEILTADPLQLVCILYRGALEAVTAARLHLRNGEIRERARCVNKAFAIVGELMLSLDRGTGSDLYNQLAPLYVYIQERLLEGNGSQSDKPLGEAEALLKTLFEAWIATARTAPPIAEPLHTDCEYVPLSCSY